MKRLVAALCIPALALSACTAREDTGSPDEGSTESEDLTPEGPSMTSRLFGGGEPMPLDLQVAHPNKTVLKLTSLQVKPSETVITALITNGRDQEIKLNRYGNNDTFIATGDGQKLFLSPPTTNEDLTIQPGQRIEAELVFLGELPEGTSATLMVNDGNQTGNQYTTSPGFRIPLHLDEAAFSDDGSKKN